MTKLLFEGESWDADTLRHIYDAVEPIALDDLGLDVYPNHRQIVSSEQMIDAYASAGLPFMYGHWSFGKSFAQQDALYRKGWQGLAYELIINSNPCISYYMEENSAAMQLLTTAHAAFGHNHFFKNNYLFKEWTDASAIIDYLQFACAYIAKHEEKYGVPAVERILDAAHALQSSGVFRAKRPAALTPQERRLREQQRKDYEADRYSDLWHRTVPQTPVQAEDEQEDLEGKVVSPPHLPEESLLYFLEKYSPSLKSWEREILRIVRVIAQYFYPQRQTKMMNEGCATFVHYYTMQQLWEKGRISDGALLELLRSHTSVIYQPNWNDRRYSGFNPYALGFKMMMDIRRICEDPTPEDIAHLPQIAGKGDWRSVLKDAWANYRDDSFVMQFLSPTVIRDFKMFSVLHESGEKEVTVDYIQNAAGFYGVREVLARQYRTSETDPDIQVVDADFKGDRTLRLRHHLVRGKKLDQSSTEKTLQYLAALWTYPIVLEQKFEDGQVATAYSVEKDDVRKVM